MFKHEKQLLQEVKVERPNPTYAALLTEQLGGSQGELKAAMQYMSQSLRIKDPAIKDLFMDIAAEELSHMEMVATTVNLLNGHDVDAPAVAAGHIESHVLTGLNPALANASGYLWTAAYVNVTGDLPADLLSNIAAEQRAKVVYEYLHRQIKTSMYGKPSTSFSTGKKPTTPYSGRRSTASRDEFDPGLGSGRKRQAVLRPVDTWKVFRYQEPPAPRLPDAGPRGRTTAVTKAAYGRLLRERRHKRVSYPAEYRS